jgi:imidazole glycerol-phosphate synthase subunit HisH
VRVATSPVKASLELHILFLLVTAVTKATWMTSPESLDICRLPNCVCKITNRMGYVETGLRCCDAAGGGACSKDVGPDWKPNAMQVVGLVKMPIANLRSAWNALYEIGMDPIIVDETSDLDLLSHLIVPGVGHFQAVMRNLQERGLAERIRAFGASGRPLLGICVGMQLLAREGTEGGLSCGLDMVPGRVERLPESKDTRLPHVGWNTLRLTTPHPVFEGIKPGRDFYFVHSYAVETDDPSDTLGETEYGRLFASVIARGNIVGCQFHPEKSQVNGLKLLENFCEWNGQC